jgi:hypothetical protein
MVIKTVKFGSSSEVHEEAIPSTSLSPSAGVFINKRGQVIFTLLESLLLSNGVYSSPRMAVP